MLKQLTTRLRRSKRYTSKAKREKENKVPRAGADLAVYPLEPPTGGLNGTQSLFNMPESDCVDLINMVPKGGGGLRSRTGTSLNQDFSGALTAAEWDYLATVIGDINGQPFIVIGNDQPGIGSGEFYAIAGTTDKKGTATVPDDPDWVHFKNKAFFAGLGGTGPGIHAEWDGSGNLANTAWTFVSWTSGQFTTIGSYKGRLYFGNNDKLVYATSSTLGAVTGNLTLFDISEFAQRDGGIADLGDLPVGGDLDREVLFYLFTTRGELFLYSGDSPFASNWQLVGRYELPPPIEKSNRRICTVKVPGDVWLITRTGVISMRSVLAGSPIFITAKIADLWQASVLEVESFNPSGSQYSLIKTGIRGTYNSTRDYVIFYHPAIGQLGYHLPTGGWFKFDLNARAFHFNLNNDNLIMADTIERGVYSVDQVSSGGWGVDPDGELVCSFKQAYSALGDRRTKKSTVQLEPYISVDVPASGATAVEFTYRFNPDYRNTSATTVRTDSLTQNTINYLNSTIDVVEEGKVISLEVSAKLEAGAEIEWQGANVYYTQGGV